MAADTPGRTATATRIDKGTATAGKIS
jgi:hypothetical protein